MLLHLSAALFSTVAYLVCNQPRAILSVLFPLRLISGNGDALSPHCKRINLSNVHVKNKN